MKSVFFVLTSLLLTATQMWGDTPQSVLSRYMEFPEASEVYQFAQLEKVATVLDFRLYKLFNYEDPIISRSAPAIRDILSENIRLQLASDRLRNTFVTEVTDKKVISIVKETMRDLGFSETQIKNAKIEFAFGEVNAYTYGFSKDGVVVVIYDKLLEMAKNKPHELKAVLAHELGHVTAQHVQSDMQTSMMLERIFKIALSKDPRKGIDELSGSTAVKLNKAIDEAQAQSFVKLFNLSKNDAEKMTVGVMGALRGKRSQIVQLEGQIPAGELIAHSQEFLLEVVRGLNTLEIPKRTKDFFTHLAYTLPTTYRPNVDDMAEHFGILMRALSREREMTADLLGVSVVDPYVSVRFQMAVGGGGGLPEKPTRQDVRDAVDRIQLGLDLTVQDTRKEELAEILGVNGSDHPETNIRVSNQVLLSRNYQILAMRNPFLRLVVLRDKLDAKRKLISAVVSKLSTNDRAKVQVAALKEQAEKLEGLTNSLTEDIIGLIKELGLNDANPRLNNLIEYRLNDREFGLALVGFFESMLKKSKNDPLQVQYYTQKIAKTKAELAQQDSLVQSVLSLDGLSEKYKTRLHFAISQPEIKEIEALRNTMLTEQHALNRSTRADMITSVVQRKSSGLHLSKGVTHLDENKPVADPTSPSGLECFSMLGNL